MEAELRTEIEALFRELHAEFISDSLFRQTLLRAKLTELIVLIQRHVSIERTLPLHVDSQVKPDLIGKILLYLNLNYQNELTLDQVATYFFISKTYLCHVVRHHTGKTMIALLHEIRLRHACSLLISTDLKMTDLASESGFSSVKTFFACSNNTRSRRQEPI